MSIVLKLCIYAEQKCAADLDDGKQWLACFIIVVNGKYLRKILENFVSPASAEHSKGRFSNDSLYNNAFDEFEKVRFIIYALCPSGFRAAVLWEVTRKGSAQTLRSPVYGNYLVVLLLSGPGPKCIHTHLRILEPSHLIWWSSASLVNWFYPAGEDEKVHATTHIMVG